MKIKKFKPSIIHEIAKIRQTYQKTTTNAIGFAFSTNNKNAMVTMGIFINALNEVNLTADEFDGFADFKNKTLTNFRTGEKTAQQFST